MGHRMTSFRAVAVTPQPRCNLPSDLEIGAPGRKWKQCDSSDQVASSDKRIVTPVCTRIAPNTRPIMLGRVCRRIDTLYMTEMVEMSRYTSNQIAGYLGYGKQPEEVNFELPREMVFENPYFVSVQMLADAMGLEIDDATFTRPSCTRG